MAHPGASRRPSVGTSHGEILQLVRRFPEISRSDIARATGLALSTASQRVDDLIRSELLVDAGLRASRGGRRATRLEIGRGRGRIGLILIAPGHSEVRIVNLHGETLADRPAADTPLTDPQQALERLYATLIRLSREEAPAVTLDCVAIVVAAPVEQSTGTVTSPAALPGWHGTPIAEIVSSLTDIPIFVENLSNMEALAERAHTPDDPNLITVALSDHIGCGIIVHGELYRGAFGSAGEIGHNSVPADAVVSCTCTAPNCLESTASGRAIAHRLRESGFDVTDLDDIVRLGNGTQREAVDIVRAAGRLIGTAVAAVVNFFDPQQVVVSGPLASCVPLTSAIRATIMEQALPANTAQLSVRITELGNDAALRGAAYLCADVLLSPQRVDETLASSPQK